MYLPLTEMRGSADFQKRANLHARPELTLKLAVSNRQLRG